MNKYPNITKYFNRTPRGWAMFGLIFYGVTSALAVVGSLVSGFGIGPAAVALVWALIICGLMFKLWSDQTTLKKARIGKHLKKYYGLEGDALEHAFEQMNEELTHPKYADATNKKKSNAFYVTENWLLGTDGIMLMRANACRIDDIKSVEPHLQTVYRKGITYYYYILKVTNKSDYQHFFWLRSEENVQLAYDFIVNNMQIG